MEKPGLTQRYGPEPILYIALKVGFWLQFGWNILSLPFRSISCSVKTEALYSKDVCVCVASAC